ncbi:TetR/AcrR family transcriptional regulator [Saccharopolyspora rhizosphaerae]|uniref:TetR/AcrR family transcriptional regulator n=1 Tax=Saccharopolyspora rhizosphaerae TaxID=2492662 RepID=A0A3R8NWP3_9PSEU|nr:TetR/AcrR family transcriptional regulator [Saccharopolyspora rhizosphaerae]RRO14936.1 TetR/AcrR family transcriptional regulator [Saccharopolyspora rhizosphaerae]
MPTARPRRVEYSEATRQALVDSAVDLFTEHGYSQTSLDEIAKRARVTKGALYHHFGGKQALFEAAFSAVEAGVVARLSEVVSDSEDPWEATRSGLRAFLEVCLEPSYQRVVVQDGPAVMGWNRWREAEEAYTFGVLRAVVANLVSSGEIGDDLPVDALARIMFGALSAGATAIAGSSSPMQERADIAVCVERVLNGLRLS